MTPAAAVFAGLLLATGATHAERFVFHDRPDGVSCRFFDVGLGIPWASGRPAGASIAGRSGDGQPNASLQVEAGDTRRVLRIDVSPLVKAWWTGAHPNDGLLVRMRQGSHLEFHSREHGELPLRPQLALQFADKRRFVEAQADAALDCTSIRGLGERPTLLLKGSSDLALRFDLDRFAAGDPPIAAELILVRTDASRPARTTLVVERLDSPIGTAGATRVDGIASRYRADAGIAGDPGVLFADGFDERGVDRRWTRGMAAPSERIEADAARAFVPLSGAALRVTVPRRRQVGLDLRYRFKANGMSEPDEAFFRYYLWVADDWLRASEGGKLPGFAGTYGAAGWGGRPWDGLKGWSMRGAYLPPLPSGHPAHGRLMLATYAYHSKTSRHGERLAWPGAGLSALLEPRRWYCIEQRLRLNTPGREDGVFQAWIDGRLVVNLDDLRLRDAPDIHIEEVWMNFFHGGTGVPPEDLHAYIDQVVVATRYIGPMLR